MSQNGGSEVKRLSMVDYRL